MVKKTLYTPEGEIVKELTQEELIMFAEAGDFVCRLEILKQEVAASNNLTQLKNALVNWL